MDDYELIESPDGSQIIAVSRQAAAVYYPDWKPLPREIEQERREAEGEGCNEQ